MLQRENIENRVYEGKECVAFSVYINIEQKKFEFRYYKQNEVTWKMLVVLDASQDAESQVYNVCYTLPSKSIPLETLAATGLLLFQQTLEDEIQMKSNLDFTLGSILNDNLSATKIGRMI